ncbi:hypothetical protein HYV57_04285 [Candidatus Peregrinibacteria bacterium]|nr:hypothetical protein [Candidatus Peregrinibacteria bacterium]
MAEIFENTYIENTGLTPCIQERGRDGLQQLIIATANVAVNTLGDDKHLDELVITTQTGRLMKNLVEWLVKLIKLNDGIEIQNVRLQPCFSNSQPVMRDIAVKVEKGRQRSMLVAIEPMNCVERKLRMNGISRGILKRNDGKQPSMAESLDRFTSCFADALGISREQLRKISRRTALDLHKKKTRNSFAQKRAEVTEDDYDNSAINRRLGADINHGLYDFCPTTNRGAALLLTHKDRMKDPSNAVKLVAHSTMNDTRINGERSEFQNYPKNEALFRAMEEIFKNEVMQASGLTREKLLQNGIIEIHNAIGPLVMMALIEMGYIDPKNAFEEFMNFNLSHINPSGGLLAGHPLSATFPMTVHTSRLQLLKQAGEMQIDDPHYALFQSIWGLRDRVSLSIIQK